MNRSLSVLEQNYTPFLITLFQQQILKQLHNFTIVVALKMFRDRILIFYFVQWRIIMILQSLHWIKIFIILKSIWTLS